MLMMRRKIRHKANFSVDLFIDIKLWLGCVNQQPQKGQGYSVVNNFAMNAVH